MKKIRKLLAFSFEYLKAFGFKKFEVFLSTMPTDKYVGETGKNGKKHKIH